MATHDKRPLNSHDDPVMVDNGPFRLDIRGMKKPARRAAALGEVAKREFTFFSQLVVTVIQGNDFEPPTVLRLLRTPALVFHLAKGSAKRKVTLTWKQGGDPNQPYANALVVDSEIELASDGKGRLKATDANFRVTKIEQVGGNSWTRSGSGGTLLVVLIPETEPAHR